MATSSFKMSKSAKRQLAGFQNAQKRSIFKKLTIAAEIAEKFAPRPRVDRNRDNSKNSATE